MSSRVAGTGGDDVLIRAEGVSKKFCRSLKRSLWYGIQDVVGELNPFSNSCGGSVEQELRTGEFWAVNDVSFELKRGECLGLIGHNGAGKTTLLRLLNGLIKPDRGHIQMRGRVGALIALGAGFNPILSGRENIYVNAAVLGLTKREIESQIDEIIDFAQIGEFIDAPVQSYSSGMQVRLGFAVATALQPDVLLLDEVLAVGDASFRHKCYNRINKIIKNCAVILVSHAMDSIGAISTSVGFMNRGEFTLYKEINEGMNAYNEAMRDNTGLTGVDGGRVFEVYPPIKFAKVVIENPVIEYGGALEVCVQLELTEPLDDINFSFTAINQFEQPVMNWNLSRGDRIVRLDAGNLEIRIKIENLHLHDGVYRWAILISRRGAIEANLYGVRAGSFTIKSRHKPVSNIPYLPPPTDFRIVVLSQSHIHDKEIQR
jgi:lipopolysaccharide transport system ATP-binding protein